jgi:hypothetical protein
VDEKIKPLPQIGHHMGTPNSKELEEEKFRIGLKRRQKRYVTLKKW